MEKQTIIDPLSFYSTVGEEMEEILASSNIDINYFLNEINWNNQMFRKEKYSIGEIKKFSAFSKIPDVDSYLINFQKNYFEAKERAEKSFKENKKIFNKIKHLRPLLRDQFNEGVDLLEDIANFLDIEDESKIFESVENKIALYKISDFEPDNLNLYAWLKRGELDFLNINLPSYDESLFINWLKSFDWNTKLNSVDYFLSLPEILKDFGIGLIYTPYLEKTVFGAVRWFNGRPLIQVSDKGKCLATAWYTLFHEFGHVILHKDSELFDGIDQTNGKIGKIEREANQYAYDLLFGGDGLRKYIFSHKGKFVNNDFINSISKNFNAPELFVTFWMKKANVKSYNRNEYCFNLSF